MKVLFDHPFPFQLAHGGLQTQIEQTRKALEEIGVEVEWLRWWDDAQDGDIIHYFGRPGHAYIRFAQEKGRKVVMAELLTGLGSRSASARAAQRAAIRVFRRSQFFDRMGWQAYQLADASVALTAWEAQLMREVFDAPRERVWVIPNGVEREFFEAPPSKERGKWLICTATIAPRKRVLELATAAVAAGTPLWVIGKPYSEQDEYGLAFRRLCAERSDLLRYEGGISDRMALAEIYREARGFVLLSTMESLSLSALEAAACECPLLLSDLPWARSSFGSQASYCSVAGLAATAQALRRFYDAAPTLPVPPKPISWLGVAGQLKQLYERLLSKPRTSR